MEHFAVTESGLLTDTAAKEQAAWYQSKQPDIDPLDFEAHVMLMRAYDVLKTDAPFDNRTGISMARYNVLRMLHSADGQRLVMTEIVTGLNVSPTNITKLVDGLERDDMVRRAADIADKRRVWVELLPAGSAAVEKTYPHVLRHVTELWQGVSREDKRVLVHLLAKLRLDVLTRRAGGQVEGVVAAEAGRRKARRA